MQQVRWRETEGLRLYRIIPGRRMAYAPEAAATRLAMRPQNIVEMRSAQIRKPDNSLASLRLARFEAARESCYGLGLSHGTKILRPLRPMLPAALHENRSYYIMAAGNVC